MGEVKSRPKEKLLKYSTWEKRRNREGDASVAGRSFYRGGRRKGQRQLPSKTSGYENYRDLQIFTLAVVMNLQSPGKGYKREKEGRGSFRNRYTPINRGQKLINE